MLRKYGPKIAGLFCIFYLLSNPAGAAQAVKATIGGLSSAAGSGETFVNELGK